MRIRGFLLALALVLTAGGAGAACLLDINRLTLWVLEGRFEQARQWVRAEAGAGACGCDTDDSPCLRLGPEGADQLSLGQMDKGLNQLAMWDKTVRESCGTLPETDDPQRTAKLECYEKASSTFREHHVGPSQQLFAELATKLATGQTEPIRSYFQRKKEAEEKAKQDALTYRKAVRARQVAQELCPLLKEHRILLKRKTNVGRHPNSTDHLERGKEPKIEYQIKKIEQDIERLKMEFEAVAEKSFFSYEWCDKKSDP